jgi:hypothetical protein
VLHDVLLLIAKIKRPKALSSSIIPVLERQLGEFAIRDLHRPCLDTFIIDDNI